MSILKGGLDEVGWGAIAGPVISVVAVFREKDLAFLPNGVKDSKKTTAKQRGAMYSHLCAAAYDIGIGHAWPWEIDELSPFKALQLSYTRALEEILPERRPHILIVDGSNRVQSWKWEQRVEPKADANHPEVSAASIIAKFFRDSLMESYAHKRRLAGLPDYDWGSNKGYESKKHQEEIKAHGLLCDQKNHELYIHRRVYCRKYLVGVPGEAYLPGPVPVL